LPRSGSSRGGLRFTIHQQFSAKNGRMTDENTLTLRQIDGARGDLYAISEEIEVLKVQLARLPSRAYVSRTVLMATASIWALIGVLALVVR
jgi:hypothetical protein